MLIFMRRNWKDIFVLSHILVFLKHFMSETMILSIVNDFKQGDIIFIFLWIRRASKKKEKIHFGQMSKL